MLTRYKIGKLPRPIHARPGDHLRVTHTDLYKDGDLRTILHTEEITRSMECTHYAVLATSFSMGTMIGTDELENFPEESFPGCGIGEDEPIL